MAGVEESKRRRVALALVLAGLALVVFGVVLTLEQMAQVDEATRPVVLSPAERTQAAHRLQQILIWLLILVGIFAVASLAFMRWSRQFRRWLMHQPAPATPDGDVWAMHRLPDEEPPDEPGATGDTEPPPAKGENP